MKYNSTRAGVNGVSFEAALFAGYAEDGGLFVPERIPKIDMETLKEWKQLKLRYPEVVRKVIRLYIPEDEISDQALYEITTEAFDTFYNDDVISTKEVKDKNGRLVKIVELFHGRTGSFKDLGLSVVGQLMQHYMNKSGNHVTVVVGTSGDTGSAAIEAIRPLKSVDIIVLYPKGMISAVQEIQMKSALEENVHLYAVEGTSDDLDVPIAKCFPARGLMSINSINWARIMIQISHYVYLYLSDESDDPIHVIVPTGAGGNLAAGIYAKKMGIPINLYAATNHNDCLSVVMTEGELFMNKTLVPSAANAMDIAYPYNVERIFHLCGADPDTIESLMKGTGSQKVPEDLFKAIQAQIKGSKRVDDELIFETIRSIWEHNKYPICPHTATGVKYFTDTLAAEIPESSTSVYVLATASPYKFDEVVKKAGLPDEWSAEGSEFATALIGARTREPKLMKRGEDWYQILQDQIAAIEARRIEAAHYNPAEVSLGTSVINSTEVEAQEFTGSETTTEGPDAAVPTKKKCNLL